MDRKNRKKYLLVTLLALMLTMAAMLSGVAAKPGTPLPEGDPHREVSYSGAVVTSTWSAVELPDGEQSMVYYPETVAYSEDWELAMAETFRSVDKDLLDSFHFRLYTMAVLTEGGTARVVAPFRKGFAPALRRDQLQSIAKFSAKLYPDFDWQKYDFLDVGIGVYRLAFNNSMSDDDMPFITLVGLFDPQDHSKPLAACLQLTSPPLQRADGTVFYENTLYPMEDNKSIYAAYSDFMAVYNQYVPGMPTTDDALIDSDPYGGTYATARQRAALAGFYKEQGWIVGQKTDVAMVRPNVLYPDQSPLGPNEELRGEILANAQKSGLVGDDFALAKEGIRTFFHGTRAAVTQERVPYLIKFCAALDGNEKDGYTVELAWIEATPGKWSGEEANYPLGSSGNDTRAFPVSATQKEIEEWVDGAPGLTSAEMEKIHEWYMYG